MNATVLHILNSPVSEWCYINKRALPCVVQYKLSMHPGEKNKTKIKIKQKGKLQPVLQRHIFLSYESFMLKINIDSK